MRLYKIIHKIIALLVPLCQCQLEIPTLQRYFCFELFVLNCVMKSASTLSKASMCCSVKLTSKAKANVTMTTERNESKHGKILQMTNLATLLLSTHKPHYEESLCTHRIFEERQLLICHFWEA